MERRGFTLIELLVVIAIIAVLMAILMPSLRLARDQGRFINCVNNLRSLSLAWFMYQDDNDNKLVDGHVPRSASFKDKSQFPDAFWVEPPQDEATTYMGDSNPTVEHEWWGIKRGALYRYVKEIDVYRCPSDQRKRNPLQATWRSYAIAGGMNGEEKYPGWTGRAIKWYSEIRNPATKYVFVEESDNRGWNMGSWVLDPVGGRWIDPLAIWHNKRSCLGFADGHAEKHRWLDERTIEMSENQSFNENHPGSLDLRYMLNHYELRPP
ncbi:MAG: type II secretion system protein [Phycisphaerales bacterium]|nr:MAG: type II secretion system protein [Phycisphaerales bacterium]